MNFRKNDTTCPLCGQEANLYQEGLIDCDDHNMMVCLDCQLGFQHPLPNFEKLKDYYTEEYRDEELYRYVSPEEYFKAKQKLIDMRWQHLKDYFGVGQVVLDVGCGAGQFMQRVQDAGARVEGIEPWQPYAHHARRFGVVLEATIEEAKLPQKYDHICLFHVLEHIRYPNEILDKLRQHTVWGGRLLVEVPNLWAPLTIGFHTGKKFHKPHLWYFSPVSLRKILKESGWYISREIPHQRQGLYSLLFRFFIDEVSRLNPGIQAEDFKVHCRDFMRDLLLQTDGFWREQLQQKQMTDTLLFICSHVQEPEEQTTAPAD